MSTNNRTNESTPRQAAPNATAPVETTHDHIRGRAYEIYCERCERNEGGDHVSDWLQAEQELNEHAQSQPVAERSSNRSEPHDRPMTGSQARDERLVHARSS